MNITSVVIMVIEINTLGNQLNKKWTYTTISFHHYTLSQKLCDWLILDTQPLLSKSDIRALPVSNLSAAPVMHGCIPASGGL